MTTELPVADRVEIADLLPRLARLLDEGRFEDADAVYADDASVRTPRGDEIRGIGEIVDYLRKTQVEGELTQHVNSAPVVTADGEQAAATADQLVYFYRDGLPPHKMSGLRLTYTAARTPAGWRFREARITLAWTRET
jgi:hypothetical protein